MHIFPHSIALLKVIDHILQQASECTIKLPCFQFFLSSSNFLNIVSNSTRMHNFATLLLKISQQFQLQEHRFKQRQNAPYIVLDFKMLSAVPTSDLFPIASECTIYCPCFQHFLLSKTLKTRMHLLASLVSKLSQQCQLWFIQEFASLLVDFSTICIK